MIGNASQNHLVQSNLHNYEEVKDNDSDHNINDLLLSSQESDSIGDIDEFYEMMLKNHPEDVYSFSQSDEDLDLILDTDSD